METESVLRTSPGSILYQNRGHTVILLDIPQSIAEAQGLEYNALFGSLVSREPQQTPYPASNEPKSASTRAKAVDNSVDQTLHAEYRAVINGALNEIKETRPVRWCHSRKVTPIVSTSTSSKKKLLAGTNPKNQNDVAQCRPDVTPESTTRDECSEQLTEPSETFFASSSKHATPLMINSTMGLDPVEQEMEAGSMIASFGVPTPTNHRIYHNPHDNPTQLIIKSNPGCPEASRQQHEAHTFNLPPRSTFLLGDCSDSPGFRQVIKSLSQTHDTPTKFDIILLDPPWPNASARRKGAYITAPTLRMTKNLLWSMDLDIYLKPGGYVGIWITNKSAVRNMVLGPGGLFEHLNVSLCEEWIWVKVTAQGETIFPLESLWRKPYEVFLLGRAPSCSLDVAKPLNEVKRRVVVGVPDLHSRKPCLRRLIETVILNVENYDALEVFGRHLVSGWWSWGNEVLRYNWSGWWSE